MLLTIQQKQNINNIPTDSGMLQHTSKQPVTELLGVERKDQN